MASAPPVAGGGAARRPPVTADAMMHGRPAGHDAAAGETAPSATNKAIIPPLLPPPAAQTGTLLPATATTTTTTHSPHPAASSYLRSPPSREARSLLPAADPGSAAPQHHNHEDASIPKMIFSDLYTSPRSPLAKLRHSQPQPAALALQPDFDADLVSRDKAKQKEAVKRFLAEKVRNDWDFPWPSVVEPASSPSPSPAPASAPASASASALASESSTPDHDMEGFLEVATEDRLREAPSTASDDDDDDEAILDSGDEADSETESVYSSVSEDPVHFRPRAEWVSDLSDDEDLPTSASPFRFDSPESVAIAVKTSSIARKAHRRRQLRKEMTWNRGLECYEARRNAWTGARTVRVRPKPATPSSPTAPRRGLFWRARTHSTAKPPSHPLSPTTTHSPTGAASLSPVTTSTSQHSAPSTAPTTGPDSATSSLCPKTTGGSARRGAGERHPVETLLPLPPPLLPPQNPMRASITPALYVSIYDKVVVHGLQPSCPINLSDTIRACVSGWKRDGEWPPRPTEPQAAVVAVRRKQQKQQQKQQQREAKASAPLPSPGGAARRMSLGFLAARGGAATSAPAANGAPHADGEDGSAGGVIKRGLYRVLSLGHGHPSPPASANGSAAR